ncbi:MAG: dCTP deaminase [Candidatus Thorarchaeota archaeon]
MIVEDINTRLFSEDNSKRITITPLISEKQINGSVIDLRLGTEFILTKKTKFSSLDLREDDLEMKIKRYQEKVIINIGDNLILHPNQFVIGSTLEYLKLPNDIIAYIIGRSSWGRLGLIIATATLIHPGFAGVITLEITNVGEVPISLYPGLRIAQISFHLCDFKHKIIAKPKSKYFGSTGPSFSEIYRDEDKILIENREGKEKEENLIL